MVFKFSGENQVVATYKLSILGVFIAILLTALFLSGYQYRQALTLAEQQQLSRLDAKAQLIETELAKAVQSLEAIKRFADYSLNFPHELAPTPVFKQDNELFYLDKARHDVLAQRQHLSVNITGIGKVDDFDQALKQELAMANMLTPAFNTAQNSVKVANWFSYISLQRFIGLYPWIGRQNWQYNDRLINRDYFQRIKSSSPHVFTPVWSQPYLSSAGKNLYVALAAGVFRQQELTGAVVINIDLARVKQILTKATDDDYHYILLNNAEQLLLHLDAENESVSTPQHWHSVLPADMQQLTYERLAIEAPSFKFQPQSANSETWLIQQHRLPDNDWLLVKYKKYHGFITPVYQHYIWVFIGLFIGQLVLLTIVYLVTYKTFIKPTQRFISHIAHSAKGDHGKITPPDGWQHWFDIVGDIFSQNRSLLQQLKDQNSVLDLRVHEKTQALLEKSQQHQHDYAILRSVMDAIPDYLIFNDVNGHVIGCNLAFEQYLGQKEQLILGTSAGKLIENELGQALLTCTQSAQTKKSQCGIFQVIETRDNTYELFSSEFYNQQHKVLGSIIVIRDVTKQYAVNAALEQAKEQAELANKAKSQFLANMSHEIRTPINAIQGMQSLLRQTALTNQQKQHLSYAQDASDALLHLVDELLDFAKIESGNMSIYKKDCDLDHLVNQAIRLNIANVDRQKVELNVSIAPDVPVQVYTDEMRLIQVLSNLLNNAIKFTHDGEITLSLDVVVERDDEVLVCFNVTDTGIGIEKSKQAELFNAFVQADESMTREYGGSGLGLSICQRIVNLLGGEIKLTSEFGQGASFSFVLPLKVSRPEYQLQQSQSVNIYSLQCQFPDNFQQLIHSLGFQWHSLSALTEVSEKPKAAINILFLTLDEINEASCEQILNELACSKQQNKATQQCLLAIYQAQQNVDINQSYELLERYQIPYVICQAPLYRYALLTVLQALSEQTQANIIEHSEPEIARAEAKNDTALIPPASHLHGVSILLVEDNLVNQLVAKELLKSMQASVTIAENGQQALDLLNEQTFDVVLMDIQMPVMDGLTATKHIRAQEKYRHLPIIAMTAHARQEDKDSSYAAGMDRHIAKPVKAEVLLANIQAVLAYKF